MRGGVPHEVPVVRPKMDQASSSSSSSFEDDVKDVKKGVRVEGVDLLLRIPASPAEAMVVVPECAGMVATVAPRSRSLEHDRAEEETVLPLPGSPERKRSPPREEGAILAAHIGGQVVAYTGMQDSGRVSVTSPLRCRDAIRHTGLIHVFNCLTGQQLHFPGPRGAVRDLAFARIFAHYFLAAVDQMGGVLLVEVGEDADEVRAMKTLMRVDLPFSLGPAVSSKRHRLCWCPFMPETEEQRVKMETGKGYFVKDGGDNGDYNPALLLAVTHNSMVEVIQVDQVMRNSCGSGHSLCKSAEGRIQSHNLGFPLSLVSVAPTGSTLAVVPEEQGRQVCFFSFAFNGSKRGLRKCGEWEATSASTSVSGIWFLDNLSQGFTEELLWSHALVGEQGNTVLSIWNLVDWRCLQTLRIADLADGSRTLTLYPDSASGKALVTAAHQFEVAVDPSARFAVALHVTYRNYFFVITFEAGGQSSLRFSSVRQLVLKSPVQAIVTSCSGNPETGKFFVKHMKALGKCKVSLKVGAAQEKTSTEPPPSPSRLNGGKLPSENAAKEDHHHLAKDDILPTINKGPSQGVQAAGQVEEQEASCIRDLHSEVVALRKSLATLEFRLMAEIEATAERNLALLETLKKEMELGVTERIVASVMDGMESVCVDFLVPEIARAVLDAGGGSPLQVTSGDGGSDTTVGQRERERVSELSRIHKKKAMAYNALKAGSLQTAFEHAIALDDDDFMMELCSRTNFSRLLTSSEQGEAGRREECPFSQLVLLNIVLLLGNNLENRTDYRLSYLRSAWTWINQNYQGDPNMEGYHAKVRTNLLGKLEQLLISMRKRPERSFDMGRVKIVENFLESL